MNAGCLENWRNDITSNYPPVRMPTIVAVCPYCRAGGVRAPESALGASATCPKCGSCFTVMPSEGARGWAANPTPATSSTPTAPVAPPASRPGGIDETKPTFAMSDVTNPSRVVPPEAKESRPAPTPAPVSEPDDDPETATDFGLVVALSALALVGVAVLATLFPFGRFIAGTIAGLGLLGGLASLGAEGRAKAAGGLAAGLHFILLAVVLLAPSWLNLGSWRGNSIEDGPPAPLAFSHANQRTSIADWVDASSASWQFKDVRATVRSAIVGPIDLIGPKGAKRASKEQYLQLTLRVANIGVERPLDLSGWAVGQGLEQVQLTDSAGRTLKPALFEEGWLPDSPPSKPTEKVFPGKTSEVRLIFSAPQPRIDFLRLVLPGTMFGFEEVVKFQISSGWLIQTTTQKK